MGGHQADQLTIHQEEIRMSNQMGNPPAPARNNTVLIVVVVIVLLCCCCAAAAAAYYLWFNGDALLNGTTSSFLRQLAAAV